MAQVLARFHEDAPRVAADGAPVLAVERRLTREPPGAAGDRRAARRDRASAGARAVRARVRDRPRPDCWTPARAAGRSARSTATSAPNTCCSARRVQVVDCVEFDRGLRELDVADDLAFLVMDLAARGGERFGGCSCDAYRDAGGDPGEDRLIAFYAAYRALVRAKVALLRAAQHPGLEQRARPRERRRPRPARAGRAVRLAGEAAAGDRRVRRARQPASHTSRTRSPSCRGSLT